mgnify:CR=1 FL=1
MQYVLAGATGPALGLAEGLPHSQVIAKSNDYFVVLNPRRPLAVLVPLVLVLLLLVPMLLLLVRLLKTLLHHLVVPCQQTAPIAAHFGYLKANVIGDLPLPQHSALRLPAGRGC